MERYELLNSAINDKRQIYVHLVEEGNQKWRETLNREQQLQFICELVMQRNRKQFRVGGIKMNWEIKNILSDMEIIKEKLMM